MTNIQAEIIVALAENEANVSRTAKKIFMHRTTVNYHIKKIRQTTGKNPLDFYDLCELLPMAKFVMLCASEHNMNALYEMGRKAHGGKD